MSEGSDRRTVRGPSLAGAIIPLAVLACLIAGALAIFGLDALEHVEPVTESPTDRPPA